MKPTPRRLLFSRLSIEQRLPLLICILLLAVIITFGSTAYLGIKNAELSAGKERLNALTNQLNALFEGANNSLVPAAKKIAHEPAIKAFLQTNGRDSGNKVKLLLNNAREDTIMPLLELFNAKKTKVLSSDTPAVNININRSSILPDVADTAFGEAGKLYLANNKMYFPVVVAVADTQTIGYIILWRRLVSTREEIDAISQLMGSGSAFYLGNNDGSFWTDGLTPIPAPPVDLKNVDRVITYTGPKNYTVIASAKPLANSRWLLLIALSQQKVIATANRFLSWIFVVGGVLIVAGILAAWFMSRNITKPLKNLTAAASSIAKGNYSLHVDVHRDDELGKLAAAFNTMAVQVRNAQHDLEKKVEHRTAELETANKELEAFSYSVSHDLHQPLRIIDGYATVLSKKFSDKLDEEGAQLLGSIKARASRMGRLIDELLHLSYLGKKELTIQHTDMNTLMKAVVKEQLILTSKHVEIKTGNLEAAVCDNTLIRQVWSNLISNAIKYSATREHPRIEIGSYKKDDEIIYSVKDNGVGFDMKYAGKLFSAFQRLHPKEFEGTGVGLALVQRVVVKHGGTVWAEAEVDKGAIFYFSLPVKNN